MTAPSSGPTRADRSTHSQKTRRPATSPAMVPYTAPGILHSPERRHPGVSRPAPRYARTDPFPACKVQMEKPMLHPLRSSHRKAFFSAHVLFAFFLSSLVLAHESHHPPAQQAVAATVEERSFLADNDAAMTKMMNDMAVKPSGDIDCDFVAMMTPHHQGAINMAVLELRYGKNEQLRRIAQEIIVDQMQEIAAMKLAIGEPVSASEPAPTQSAPAPTENNHHGIHVHVDTTNANK